MKKTRKTQSDSMFKKPDPLWRSALPALAESDHEYDAENQPDSMFRKPIPGGRRAGAKGGL